MTLKSRCHWVPSNMSATAAMFSPPGSVSRRSKRAGKSAVAGIEATICTTGCARRAQVGFSPIATPTGTVQAAPIMRASEVRSSVAPAPAPISSHSPMPTPDNRRATAIALQSTSPARTR
jgi:hypothetical protein